ncbi:succinate dehydrogenase/fumarate reductase flavoprotein subunit [Williamsia limnetica]|uniref:Succinate dehydrogenase/fumarate reductase flavoprotein subunit n=1 Tax=Williamsia limnetica TaxID=882452 RepID=A0A318RJP4_WILLI|nr:FAD-binding protein [Williamsia limnetica]PYE18031.1 succinate dehydrogenase/fumarate reductase flavoprotein subunit [Williamsia limnetica]
MKAELPEVVAVADVDAWTDEVDVLVVGCGVSGGSAAVAAASDGAKVLVLERAAVAGGTSSMAGGHFYLGGGTAVQKATGHDDSAEEMEKYLLAVSRDPEPEKIHAYSHGSVEHFDWLESLGFEFERSYYPEKAVIQPETQGLMYTGNEKVWPFCEQAVPAPRGHKVPVKGDLGGAGMVVDLLVKRLAELGTEIRYETGARNLVVDELGSVVGVKWKRLQETGFIKAKSVVIAAGGFVMNETMVAEFVPQMAEKPYTLGSTYDDGLGIRLGASVGAALKHMDQPFVTAPVYPPSILLTGLAVNKDGNRFVNEDSYHSRTSAFVMEQPDAIAYLIVDEAHLERPEFPLAPLIDGWETVAEMEAALGIPTGNLEKSLNRYNENAARGEDPDFNKRPEWLAPQDSGPWGAFDLSLGKAMYAGFTMGGVATSVDGEVLTEAGEVVPGLYAAGAGAANIAQDGKGYASGTQLGEGSFFGRRAGRHAAAR